MVFILSALWWKRIKGLCRLPDARNWLWGKLGLVLVGKATLISRAGTFICYSILLPSGELFIVCRKVKMCLSSFFKHSPPLELWPPLLFFYIGIKIISDLVQSNLKCDVPVFCIDNITCVCPNLRGRRRHFFLCVFQSPVYILDTCINNLYLYIYFWFLFVLCLVRSGFI